MTLRTKLAETMRNVRKNLETPMASETLCKTYKKSKHGVTCRKTNDFKLKFACILEASESTLLRMEEYLPNCHEDPIAGKGDNSLQHYNLVHKFISMPQAKKIPAAKAAVDKLTCFDLLHSPNGRPWTSHASPMSLVHLDEDVKDVCGLGGATNNSPSDARSLAPRNTVTCEGQVWLRRLTTRCVARPMQRPLLLLLLMLHGLHYSNTRRPHLGQNIAPAPASIFDAPSQHLLLVFTTASVATDVNFDDTGSVSSIFQYCCGDFFATGHWFTSCL